MDIAKAKCLLWNGIDGNSGNSDKEGMDKGSDGPDDLVEEREEERLDIAYWRISAG